MHKVFVDANVLYSRTLRDWLFILHLETGNMFSIHSTEDVLAETLYRLRRKYPEWPGAAIKDLRQKLADNIDDVVGDYDPTIEYPFSDPNDRHVHAAAVACGAEFLLTIDGGFKAPEPDAGLPYEVYTADEFFMLIEDSQSDGVMRATNRQREYWQKKADAGHAPKSLAGALVDAGCSEFAKKVETHLQTLSGLRRKMPKKDRLNATARGG